MPIRRPNLLDAFRKADDTPPAPPGRAPAVPVPAARPAPVQPSAPAPAPASAELPHVVPAPPRAPASAAPAPARSLSQRERVLLVALGGAVVALVAVVAWKAAGPGGGADPVEAAPSAGSGAAAQPNAAARPPAPAPAPAVQQPAPQAAAKSPLDQALYDAQNRFTVQLIQYPNDERGLALASEAWRYLTRQGYPVASPIRLANGRGIVLCADARATSEELIPMRDNLRQLRYPESSKTTPFATAYIENIDNVLAR